MFEALFGTDLPLPLKFFIAFVLVLALIGGAAWLVRRFGPGARRAARRRLHVAAAAGTRPAGGPHGGARTRGERQLVAAARTGPGAGADAHIAGQRAARAEFGAPCRACGGPVAQLHRIRADRR